MPKWTAIAHPNQSFNKYNDDENGCKFKFEFATSKSLIQSKISFEKPQFQIKFKQRFAKSLPRRERSFSSE
jgi:hypothetical protein